MKDVCKDFDNKLKLNPQQGLSFVETAVKQVTQVFGSQWTDEKRPRAYKWKSPSELEKAGDEAEELTLKLLTDQDFVDLMQEPIYLISGREYCYLKSGKIIKEMANFMLFFLEPAKQASKWMIGENDIVLMTRKLGIVNIEVKGNDYNNFIN